MEKGFAETTGRELRRLIWDPIAETVGEAETVLVSPDGILGTVAFQALPGRRTNSYLVEDHRIVTIPVPRLLPLLMEENPKELPSHVLLAMGGVDYQHASAEKPEPKKRDFMTNRLAQSGSDRAASDGQQFDPLSQTREEMRFVANLCKEMFTVDSDDVIQLTGSTATESRFRDLAPHCFHLHIATHGFFADPSKKSAFSPESAEEAAGETSSTNLPIAQDTSSSGTAASSDLPKRRLIGLNPGLLSGLAFAGANREPEPDQDDGILTAQEISFLPLNGVDTVVLSACDTGLGKVAGGEGLLGVQRAFQISGARTTIASLWNVDDLTTRLLMERFYKNLWEDSGDGQGMSKIDALWEAQLWILRNPDVIRGAERVHTQATRTPPYYWAAFSLSGDWR